MKTNQSLTERAIRLVVGLVMVWFSLYKAMTPAWLLLLAILGLILIVTGLSGYCPIWDLLKINTNKK